MDDEPHRGARDTIERKQNVIEWHAVRLFLVESNGQLMDAHLRLVGMPEHAVALGPSRKVGTFLAIPFRQVSRLNVLCLCVLLVHTLPLLSSIHF